MLKWLWGPNLITKSDRLGTYAAALAYCFVLSLVPFFIVTFVVGMHLTLELDINSDYYKRHYAEVLGNIIPSQADARNIVETVTNVEGRNKGWIFVVGFLFALYTSYNLMEQILRTLLFIFDDPRRPNVWSWLGVVKTVGLLLIWMILLLLVSVSAVEAAILRQLLYDFLHLEAGGKAGGDGVAIADHYRGAFRDDFCDLLRGAGAAAPGGRGGGGEPPGVAGLDFVQLGFREDHAGAAEHERSVPGARGRGGDPALGTGVRVVDHSRRVLDRALLADETVARVTRSWRDTGALRARP